MTVTNYWGDIQKCIVCKSQEITKYKSYLPPFKNAIDTVFICGCKDHEAEAEREYNNRIQAKDRIETASSNS